jgi:transcriptional regulator with XRE-family HTH domain
MSSSQSSSHLISLGRSIQQLREEQGLDGDQLAEKAALQKWRLTAIEEGRHDPTFDTLVKLADALGIGTGEIAERAKAIEEEGADHA